MSEHPSAFVLWLESQMRAKRLNQAALAAYLRTGDSTVSGWLKKGVPPGIPMCKRLAAYFGVDPMFVIRLVAELDDADVLDVGRFGPGKIASVSSLADQLNTRNYKIDCAFSYTLEVPQGPKFYTVKVGRRGESTYTFEELTAPGAIAHTLGR